MQGREREPDPSINLQYFLSLLQLSLMVVLVIKARVSEESYRQTEKNREKGREGEREREFPDDFADLIIRTSIENFQATYSELERR